MLPILNIGPLAIQLPGLLLIVGLWLGLTLAERFSSRYQVNPSKLYNLVFIALISAAIGARLTYVIRYPGAFRDNLISLVSLNPGLLDPLGAVAGALIAALVYGQRKELSLWPTLDALTPLFATVAIALNLSQLSSGTAFGSTTSLPWAIDLWGAQRHPTQIYEAIAATIILIIIWPSRKHVQDLRPGVYFLSFITLSSIARLVLEVFRGDSIILPGGFRLPQVIAWIILAICFFGIHKLQNLATNGTLDKAA